MRKLNSVAELQVDRVYNMVYTGNNDAYAKFNGKQTFIVTATEPQLKTVTLYDQFGSLHSDEIRGGEITYGDNLSVFKEYDIFEPESEAEWFKKSVKVTSLDEALERRLITAGDITKRVWRTSTFVTMSENGSFFGLYTSFMVEGKTDRQYLQVVNVFWKSWNEMRGDFNKHGATIKD